MPSKFDLFQVAMAERINRLWGRHLDLDIRFKPCQPLERFSVEVMVGLPAFSTWHVLQVQQNRGIAVIDMKVLLGAIDRLLGGVGVPSDDFERGPTLVEESVGRKLVEKLLPGLDEVWGAFQADFETLKILDEYGHRSPWDPTETVIETALTGGWDHCEGVLRFLWPQSIVQEAFGPLDLKRVEVDDWRPIPWTPAVTLNAAAPAQAVQAASAQVAPAPEKKKRISFEDFDAMVAALNQK